MTLPPCPLPQSVEFAKTCQLLGIPLQQCDNAQAVWQARRRRLPLVGTIDIVSRGPIWRDRGASAEWLRHVTAHGGDTAAMLLNADGIDAHDLRVAGFWPLMTPATLALLPLDQPVRMRAAMQQKWRNRLNRAETAGLRIERRPLDDPDHWLLQAEVAQARARGYRGWPPAFSAAFAAANPGAAQVFQARRGSERLAGLVILHHGTMATYHIGHSTAAGRAANAMNLLLWQAMQWLSAQRVGMLDLGTIDTQDAPGLARFKLGTGAAVHRLGGSWLWHPWLARAACRLPQALAA